MGVIFLVCDINDQVKEDIVFKGRFYFSFWDYIRDAHIIFVVYVENLDPDESKKILTLNHLFNHSHEEESFLLMLHLNEDDVTCDVVL